MAYKKDYIANDKYINGLLNGSEYIYKHIVEKIMPSLIRYMRKNSGTYEDAKDIAHEAIATTFVMITAGELNLIDKNDKEISFIQYVMGISQNLWRQKLIKRGKLILSPYLDDDLQPENVETPPPDEQLIKQEEEEAYKFVLECLKQYLPQLPKDEQDFLELRLGKKYKHAQIAQKLQIKVELSRKKQQRIIVKLRKKMMADLEKQPTVFDIAVLLKNIIT